MTAYQVKQQLTRSLRAKKQFVGAGVFQTVSGQEYVQVRLLDDDFDAIRSTIPTTIEGIDVDVKKSAPAVAW